MSWAFYLGLLAFFTVVFAVFYALAYSVVLGVRENYLRHYQKSDLQWTSVDHQKHRPRLRLQWLLLFSSLTSWLVVHFIIRPG